MNAIVVLTIEVLLRGRSASALRDDFFSKPGNGSTHAGAMSFRGECMADEKKKKLTPFEQIFVDIVGTAETVGELDVENMEVEDLAKEIQKRLMALAPPPPISEDQLRRIEEAAETARKITDGEIDADSPSTIDGLDAPSFQHATLENFMLSHGRFGFYVYCIFGAFAILGVLFSLYGSLLDTKWFLDLCTKLLGEAPGTWSQLFSLSQSFFIWWNEFSKPYFPEILDIVPVEFRDMTEFLLVVLLIIFSAFLAVPRARIIRGFVFFRHFRPFREQLRTKVRETENKELALRRAVENQQDNEPFYVKQARYWEDMNGRQSTEIFTTETLPQVLEIQKAMKSWEYWGRVFERQIIKKTKIRNSS